MNRMIRMMISVTLSLMITMSFMPAYAAWADSLVSENSDTEAAAEAAASVADEDEGSASKDDTEFNEESNNTADAAASDREDDTAETAATDTDAESAGTAAEKGSSGSDLKAMEADAEVTADADVKNGTVSLKSILGNYVGTAEPDEGYDLATVRQTWIGTDGFEHERYLDYTKLNLSGKYTFDVEAAETASTVTAYFYDLNTWDGAVDVSWYDPDKTEFEISTPAQLAGLAAITNGMVDENVTAEYMIKDNGGRTFSEADGRWLHKYISTEPAEADLLTPNHMEGAGQIRDTVWRLPETEHKKIADDDIHNDFLYRTVKLTADIDMGEVNWTPVGGKYAMNRDALGSEDPKVIDTRFQGVFDGQGHTVTINCDRVAKKGFAYAMEIALIGYLGGGVDYKNGYPKDTYMDYEKYWVPTVRNVVVRGDVKGRRMVAGVVGRTGETNYGVLVEKCANFADVYATDMRGCAGIVGAAWGKAVIRDCYNSGTIRSNFWEHGGIIGSNGYEGSEDRTPAGADIYNCYNIGTTGIVSGSAGYEDDPAYDGQEIGADGQAFAPYSIANCYYPAPEASIEDRTGYSFGDTLKNKKVKVNDLEAADIRSDEILAKLNSNGDVFVKDSGNINGGYPVLYFQGESGTGKADVKLNQTEGGTIGTTLTNLRNLPYGTSVDLTVTADRGKRLTGYKVTEEGGGERIIPANGFFTVTGKDVTIEGIFADRDASTLRFIEKDDGAPFYIKVEKTGSMIDNKYVPLDEPEEIKSGGRAEMDDVIRITAYDIKLTETQPDIKYLEYTGGFNDPEYPDYSLDVYNRAKKLYTVTGDVADIDITVSAKTRGKRWTTVADTSWYSEGKKEFTLTTAKQLAGLSQLCGDGNDFAGVTIRLGNDISLENTKANSGDEYGYERSWTGIGASERYPFRGTFDGQGHTVKYMHRNFAPGYCSGDNGGLFGVAEKAVIKNVNVESGSYVNDDGAAMECGFINGANGGGIVGTAIDTVVENCSASVPMYKAFSAGGIAGTAEGETVIRNCANAGSISASSEAVGGILGRLGESGVKIENCVNSGTIESTSWKVGGILGTGELYKGSITRCVNNGSISTSMKGTSSYMHAAGGILGYAGEALTLSQSVNHGDLKGYGMTYSMGGIAGSVLRGTITDCYNTGSIYSESRSKSAQLSGIANLGTNKATIAKVINCYNSGKITTGEGFISAGIGGAVAYGNTETNVVTNAYCTDASVKDIGGKHGVAGKVISEKDLKELKVPLGELFIKDAKSINGGFPVLMWQDPEYAPPKPAQPEEKEKLLPAMKIKSVKNTKSKKAVIKWSRKSGASGYVLYRSTSKKGKYKKITTVKVTKKNKKKKTLSYTNKKLKKGKTYYYKIRYYKTVSGKKVYSKYSAAKKVKIKK